MAFKFITAEEAAEFIHHNDNVGFSGFTAAGTPKVVSVALAKKQKQSMPQVALSKSEFIQEHRPVIISTVL